MDKEMEQAMLAFLSTWMDGPDGNKTGFLRLQGLLSSLSGVNCEFIARPGITYSLRGLAEGGQRPLFVMIDVIEDQPRWLSVCFYADQVSDPQELGAFVPGGLLGEDACCFDLYNSAETALTYVEARINEAWRAAV